MDPSNDQKAQAKQFLDAAQDSALDMMNNIANAKRTLNADLQSIESFSRESAESFNRQTEKPDANLENSLNNV